MCFYSKTNEFKIAKRPIRVQKQLMYNCISPVRGYIYHKGLNKPVEKEIKSNWVFDYCYEFDSGVLHAYKEFGFGTTMYIPIGAKYNDQGTIACGCDRTNHVIATALYWPKNKFEEWWYNLISKKY